MNLLSERLRLAMQEESKRQGREIRPADVARACNSSATSVNFWLNDVNGIGAGKARLLADYLHVDPLWLETGEGSMTPMKVSVQALPKEEEGTPFLPPALDIRVGEEPDSIPIRRVNIKLRAGVSRFETEPVLDDGGVLHMPRRVIDEAKLTPHELLAIQVRGISMEPLMFEDDIIVVDTGDKVPMSKEIYAINFDGDCCVKQLVKRNGDWYLYSVNPDFGPINVRSGEISIIGRVVYQPGRVLTGRLS